MSETTSEKYYLNVETTRKVSLYLLAMGVVFLVIAFAGAYLANPAEAAHSNSSGLTPETTHSTQLSGVETLAEDVESDVLQAASGTAATPVSRLFHTYLFSYVFYMGIIFGSLFFVIIQFLTRSEWSVTVRRVPEAIMSIFPWFILLALPILLGGMGVLYHWTHGDAVAEDAILQSKSGYLNLGFFYARSAIYFIVFFFITWFYHKHSTAQDRTGELNHTVSLQKFSPAATLSFALGITFFAVDYLMSLTPHWYSTIWGIYYFSGAIVTTLSFMIVVFLVLRMRGYLKTEVNVEHYHDLGKLIFAFNIFWSYIAFSQYMLIWYANIPEGTLFFINRINGSWLTVSIFLIVGHTILPLLVYISRNAKRNLKVQLGMTLWFIFMGMVDLYWVVMPNIDHGGIVVGYIDVLVFLGMGGLFMGFFIRNLSRHAIIPIKDPRLERALKFENA